MKMTGSRQYVNEQISEWAFDVYLDLFVMQAFSPTTLSEIVYFQLKEELL